MRRITEYMDYRVFLKDELEERKRRNLHYSLRAFARDLGTSSQLLSLVLKGKKGFSMDMAAYIANGLKLDKADTAYFCDLVDLARAKTELAKNVARHRLDQYFTDKTYETLGTEVFKAISDWHHYAILELTCLKDFKSDPKWISKELGVSAVKAREAIHRLKRLKLLEDKNGTLKKTGNFCTTQDIPSAAMKKLTKQLLMKAAHALMRQKIHERNYSDVTMAIDPRKIPIAKKMIMSFSVRLMKFLEAGERTEVYCFATQLFRLTKKLPG